MRTDIQAGDYQWGLMYDDGSVWRSWNGNTQEPRARAALAAYHRHYPGHTDDVKVVRRLIGPWEPEPCCGDGPDGHTEQQHRDASACVASEVKA